MPNIYIINFNSLIFKFILKCYLLSSYLILDVRYKLNTQMQQTY